MSRPPNDCFALPPGVDWTPMDAALAHLRGALAPSAAIESSALIEAAERILAEAPVARRDHPATDNSAVDGYAFAHPGEAGAGREIALRLRDGRSAAGAPWSGRVKPGEALRILTGAPMPDGADTVALQEDAAVDGATVRLHCARKPGANRRRRGENIQAGAPLLAAGRRLGPAALAHALSGGVETVKVFAPLRVAALSTGDELAATAGGADPVDRVIDSNRPMLMALIRRLGAEAIDLGAAADREAAVIAALDRGAEQADAIVASGGASGGEEDHIARVLRQAAERDPEAAAYHQWRIAIKPGRPLAMGLWRGTPVFGLPGNPVAAFVCFLLFARPALLRLAGAEWAEPRAYPLASGFDHAKKPGRREFLRVRVGADGRLEKYRSEGSGLTDGLVWSDGLADLAHDAGPLKAGDLVRFIPYAELGAAP